MYTMLGMGAKGMLYRHNDPGGRTASGSQLSAVIPALNDEIRHIRGFLSIAMPIGNAPVEGSGTVISYTLLAGDKGVVVFLVRQEKEEEDAGDKEITIPMETPDWATVTRVFRVMPEGLTPLPDTQREIALQSLVLRLPIPSSAEGYWISFE